MVDLKIKLGPLELKNPVMTASGTWGYGLEYADFCPPESLGAIVTKGLSLKPRKGNPPPRIWETPSGMINAIGLENVGVDAFLADKLPPVAERGAVVIANFFGGSIDEYAEMARRLGASNLLAGIEANISCPNVGGCEGKFFGSTPDRAAEVTAACRKATSKFLMVKLTPETADIAAIALAVEKAGADAISLINTIPAMAIDINTRKPRIANITGGLSGPAIHPVAVRMVYEAARAVKIPVVGVGGITNADEAVEMMLAGASAVQIGTSSFVDPKSPLAIVAGIGRYLERNNFKNPDKIVGKVDIGR